VGETGKGSWSVPYTGYGDYEFRIWRGSKATPGQRGGENMTFQEFCDRLSGRYDFKEKKAYANRDEDQFLKDMAQDFLEQKILT